MYSFIERFYFGIYDLLQAFNLYVDAGHEIVEEFALVWISRRDAGDFSKQRERRHRLGR